jgi:hypothetical protein
LVGWLVGWLVMIKQEVCYVSKSLTDSRHQVVVTPRNFVMVSSIFGVIIFSLCLFLLFQKSQLAELLILDSKQ